MRCVCNLQQITKLTKEFCIDQTFVPLGLSASAPGYINETNNEKYCVNAEMQVILLRFKTNDHSDEGPLLHRNAYLPLV